MKVMSFRQVREFQALESGQLQASRAEWTPMSETQWAQVTERPRPPFKRARVGGGAQG